MSVNLTISQHVRIAVSQKFVVMPMGPVLPVKKDTGVQTVAKVKIKK